MKDKQYQDLISKLDKMDEKINILYKILKVTNADSFSKALRLPETNSNTRTNLTKTETVKSNSDRILKSEVNFDSYISKVSDPNSIKIINNIRNTKYTTITSKQLQLIKNLK